MQRRGDLFQHLGEYTAPHFEVQPGEVRAVERATRDLGAAERVLDGRTRIDAAQVRHRVTRATQSGLDQWPTAGDAAQYDRLTGLHQGGQWQASRIDAFQDPYRQAGLHRSVPDRLRGAVLDAETALLLGDQAAHVMQRRKHQVRTFQVTGAVQRRQA